MKFSFEFSRSQAAKIASPLASTVVEPGHANALRHVAGLRSLPRRGARMYDAASTDRLSADFAVSQKSANAEILVSAIAARARGRKLERDNPYAWGLLNTFQNNVGGHDPFPLRMRVGRTTPE